MNTPIYVDYAAASPLDPRVFSVMQPFFSENFYNPSAHYSGARAAKAALEDARASVARSIGARPSEITFTAGGTESANLAINGVMKAYPGSNLVVSVIEHDAVLKPAQLWDTRLSSVDKKGRVILSELEKTITDNTVLVSVMYANNEIGTVQSIDEVVALVKDIRLNRQDRGVDLPLFVHTDACQAPQFLDISIARLGVDLMTLNGGKIYGPKQSGVLYHKIGVELLPEIRGGGQELGLRSGTENVAFAVGMAKALELSVKHRQSTVKQMRELSMHFIKNLEEEYGAILNGDRKHRLPNNVHVTFPGVDNERALFYLDDNGVYAAAGSACSASSDEPSHVLRAIGLSDDVARSSIRFSFGRDTTQDELDLLVKILKAALHA